MKSLTFRILRALLIGYVIMLALLFALQRDLLYLPSGTYQTPAQLGSTRVQELWLATADGTKTLAWFNPAPEDSAGKIVVFFHGNGGGLRYGAGLIEMLQSAGFGSLTPEYRGYPGYEGSPDEAGLYHDGRSAMKFLKQRGYKPSDIILLGQSLGSGVAVQMATEYDVGLVALISPYTTIFDAAAHTYWYVPVRWLMHDRFDSASKIKSINSPLYVFHGTEDRLVPFELGQQLYAQATEPKEFFALESQGHNDMDFAFIIQQIKAFAGQHP